MACMSRLAGGAIVCLLAYGGVHAELISAYFPNIAGQTLITGADQPYGPFVGLLTLIGWAAATLLVGGAALYTRDA